MSRKSSKVLWYKKIADLQGMVPVLSLPLEVSDNSYML